MNCKGFWSGQDSSLFLLPRPIRSGVRSGALFLRPELYLHPFLGSQSLIFALLFAPPWIYSISLCSWEVGLILGMARTGRPEA